MPGASRSCCPRRSRSVLAHARNEDGQDVSTQPDEGAHVRHVGELEAQASHDPVEQNHLCPETPILHR